MPQYWKPYSEEEIKDIVDLRHRNLSATARQTIVQDILIQRDNEPDNPYRRKEMQGVHYKYEDTPKKEDALWH